MQRDIRGLRIYGGDESTIEIISLRFSSPLTRSIAYHIYLFPMKSTRT